MVDVPQHFFFFRTYVRSACVGRWKCRWSLLSLVGTLGPCVGPWSHGQYLSLVLARIGSVYKYIWNHGRCYVLYEQKLACGVLALLLITCVGVGVRGRDCCCCFVLTAVDPWS